MLSFRVLTETDEYWLRFHARVRKLRLISDHVTFLMMLRTALVNGEQEEIGASI